MITTEKLYRKQIHLFCCEKIETLKLSGCPISYKETNIQDKGVKKHIHSPKKKLCI